MNKSNTAATPVMKQFMDIKSKHHDTIVLFRMGDFYETFLEDAIITSDVLGIVLTKRSNGKAADVPLSGFPYHSLDNYLPKLVKAGYRVAVCEQTEDPAKSKGIVKREVVEVVTPGTLVSDQSLDQKSNNFISSIFIQKDQIGYSILDSSTGEFYIGECTKNQLKERLLKYSPKEIVIPDSMIYSDRDWYISIKPFVSQIENWFFDFNGSYAILIKHFKSKSLKGFGCENMVNGIVAAGALLHHVKNNLNKNINHITKLSPIYSEGFMGLDNFTIRNLEIFDNLFDQNKNGTLISAIDYTKSAGGGRLLRRWLNNPLSNKKQIIGRVGIVEGFVNNGSVLKKIRNSLETTIDLQRVMGKINQRKVSPREVMSLATTLNKISEWKKILKSMNSKPISIIADKFVDSNKIIKKVFSNFNHDLPSQLKQGNIIREGVNKTLDEYRELLNDGKGWILEFEKQMRMTLKISSLKVRYNKVFGYYIDVRKTHQEKIPDTFIKKQTLVNSERFITPDLKKYEEKILNAENYIFEIEGKIFNDICDFLIQNISTINQNAILINKLDVLATFAKIALENNYVKPLFCNNAILDIKEGRHPVIEKVIHSSKKFISNDLNMDVKNNQIHLITGPNMAGKSTFLRQNGLIVLMAQIGCYVPAKYAKIGIVDHLFTRVGASDNIASGESTFMVEMTEAANILNNATANSLILLDEIGRGTATYDGLSIAWSITEYLHNRPGINARTLFATHYHELTHLETKLKRLYNYHVEVKEFDDEIIFLRSIIKGSADKSYGIQVAKMAGVPRGVIDRATQILDQKIFNSKEMKNNSNKIFKDKTNSKNQKFITEIKNIDIDSLTPLEALTKLNELKKKIKF